MIVCVCEGLNDREIDAVVERGCSSLRELGAACGAGTGCGLCLRDLGRRLRARRERRAPRAPAQAA